MKRKTFLLLASMVGVVAILGASLGMAVAGTTSLVSGFNLVGGPVSGDVAPASWVECITPATSWNAVYIWDAGNQRWLHFFNKANGTPDYVNQSSNGGISTIPRFSGVALIMNTAVSNAKLKDSSSTTCN